ncbi:MAG: hypothetical protein HY821_17310 [Acidobacteria bacterium]|nr:hypothetical protein [Acidobacteriota bacterium]
MTSKLILAASLSVLSLLAQKAPQSAPAAKPAAKAVSGLPANAEKLGEGTYRVKDSAGKTWIYTQSPFGYSRKEEGAAPAVPARSAAAITIRAVEVTKDSVRFERDTPFGKAAWTKPLDNLEEAEKTALEKFRADSQQPGEKK